LDVVGVVCMVDSFVGMLVEVFEQLSYVVVCDSLLFFEIESEM